MLIASTMLQLRSIINPPPD